MKSPPSDYYLEPSLGQQVMIVLFSISPSLIGLKSDVSKVLCVCAITGSALGMSYCIRFYPYSPLTAAAQNTLRAPQTHKIVRVRAYNAFPL